MSKTQPLGPPQIGVHTIQYEDSSRGDRPVVVEVWYPTRQEGPFDTPKDLVWVHPKEIRDVEPTAGRHPLIMMSHGHGGDRRDRSWLVEHLVSRGYIVASVEHYGNSWKSYNPLLSLKFWDRSKDISFAINKILKDSFFKRKIDRRKIGFIGYSLGGMTGLALAGAKAQNVKAVIKRLQQEVKEIEDSMVESVDFNAAYEDYKEPRIKAMVLLSPAAYIYSPQTLQKVNVPIALVASEGDEVLPFKDHAQKVIQYLKNAKSKLLNKKASHYVFLNRVSDIGKELIRDEIKAEPIQLDRLKVHREVGEFVVTFFKEHFKI